MALKDLFKWVTGDDSGEPNDADAIDASPKAAPFEQKRDSILKIVQRRGTSAPPPNAAADAFFAEARGEIERMRKEFGPGIANFASVMPPLFASSGAKVEETSSGYTVTLDFGGFDEKDIKIEARDKMLAVSAEHRTNHNEGDGAHHVSEHFVSRVQRLVPLDAAIDASTIASTYDGRVLRITAQKTH